MNTIRSCFILQKIFKIPQKSIYLKLIKYNKKLMNRLNITIKDYKEINRIIIDVPKINILDSDYKYKKY